MKKSQICYLTSAILFFIFVIYTALVARVGISNIGPNDSSVGFATLNGKVAEAIGVHMAWYYITDILGYLAILVAVFFAALGVLELVSRKSLKKVDKDLYVLAAFYFFVIGSYVLFEIIEINFRPVLIKGELEASYPSSHTMLALCILVTAMMQMYTRLKNLWIRIGVEAGLALLCVIIVVGRVLSGVHWITDIIGGVLLSVFLISLYVAGIETFCRKKKKKHGA